MPVSPPVQAAPPPPKEVNQELLLKLQQSVLKDLREQAEGTGRTSGVLKFFNEVKNFGFLVDEQSGQDVFFYCDDVKDTKLSKEFLKESKNKYLTKFSFQIEEYFGKHSHSTRPSKKAVNI